MTDSIPKEQIDVTGEDTAARLILSAMATHVKDEDFAEKFSRHGKVCTVELTVNGHPVPIVQTLVETWNRAADVIEQRARKLAVQMVTEAGLEPLATALRDAEQSIRSKLDIWEE